MKPYSMLLRLTLIISIALPSVGFALSSDQYKPYHIQANTITYDRNLHTTVYLGNVHARQGTTLLTGDRVVVYNDKTGNTIVRIVDVGRPAKYSALTDQKHKMLHAQASTIDYYPIKHQVLLLKKARVTQDKDVFTGPHIWYDIKNQMVVSTSPGGHGRTTVVIEPQNIGSDHHAHT